MTSITSRLHDLAARQHDTVAGWQLLAAGFSRGQVDTALRGMRRVHRDVCALGDLTEWGWYMAAALALGPTAAISHVSALMLLGLRPFKPGDIHVSALGGERARREGVIPHRRRRMDVGACRGIPVTSPTQSLRDTALRPFEMYRAIEAAEKQGYAMALPSNEVVRLRKSVKGRTRSDSEAAFIWLLHERRLPLPRVNHVLNGFETDFHWPDERIVVEVDGWEHHREHGPFNRDRHRGLVHVSNGWQVVRVSADQVYDEPELVASALRRATGW